MNCASNLVMLFELMLICTLLVRTNALDDNRVPGNESLPAGNPEVPTASPNIVQIPNRPQPPCEKGKRRSPDGKCRKIW